MKDGFEISIEYIHELYQFKGWLKDKYSREQREKIRRLRELLNKTEIELKYILGHKGFWICDRCRETLRCRGFRFRVQEGKTTDDNVPTSVKKVKAEGGRRSAARLRNARFDGLSRPRGALSRPPGLRGPHKLTIPG